MSKMNFLFYSGVFLLDCFVLLCFASVLANIISKNLGICIGTAGTFIIDHYFKTKHDFLVKLSKDVEDGTSGQKNRSAFN